MNQKLKAMKVTRIFLSYAIEDSSHAQKIKSLLSQHPDAQVFTPETLSAGENWRSIIKDAIQKCHIFLAILSPKSVNSSWVLFETGMALGMGKPIITIATDPAVALMKPSSLSQYPLIGISELEKPGRLDQILYKRETAEASTTSK